MENLLVYVNDIILTGDDFEELEKLKDLLAGEFEIKDLGQLRYFLGNEVTRSKRGIVVSQRKNAIDLLKENELLGGKPTYTPINQNIKFGKEDGGDPIDKRRYQTHWETDLSFTHDLILLSLLVW